MDFALMFSLLSVFAASIFAERAVFNGRATAVERILRAAGIYISLVVLVAYSARFLALAINPLYFVAASVISIILSKKLGKLSAKTDYSVSELFSVLALLAAAALIFLTPSAPNFFPISFEVDAALHFEVVRALTVDMFKSPPPPAIYAGRWLYPVGFHTFAALHSDAFGVEPIRMVYPLLVLIIALSAVAVFAIIHSLTKDTSLSVFAGLMLLVSNYTYAILWEQGTWAQILTQLLVIILVFECMQYWKTRSWGILLVMALCMQAIFLTYTFIAVVPFLLAVGVLVGSSDTLRTKIGKLAAFSLVAVVFPIPYFYQCIQNFLVSAFDLKMPSSIFTEVGPRTTLFLFVFVVGLGRIIEKGYDLKDNAALRLFAIATLASLFAFYVASNLFGFEVYWYYKLVFVAIYPLIIYSTLVLDRILEKLSASIQPIIHSSHGAARFAVLGPILIIWLIYPVINLPHNDYHLVVTSDEYTALAWVKQSPEIKKISPVSDYISSYYWFYLLSGKQQATLETEACYFTRANSAANVNCAASQIERADSETVVFLQSYKWVTGQPPGVQRLITVKNTCANVLFSYGDVSVLSKAHNTGISLQGITLVENNASTELYGHDGDATFCTTACMSLNASRTGTFTYTFTLNETPAMLSLKTSAPAFWDGNNVQLAVSSDGREWEELRPPAKLDLPNQVYGLTFDITNQAVQSRTIYIRAEVAALPRYQFVPFMSINSDQSAITLVGCTSG